ncbi:MAG: ABC transporter substrate-binding protein [Actinomycetota bacterium]
MRRSVAKVFAATAASVLPLTLVASTPASAAPTHATWGSIVKQAAIAKELPSALKTSGILRVASDATYAPMEYLATDNTTVLGVDADLMKAISQVLGLQLHMTNETFDGIITKVQSNTYDVGASSFTDTKAREKAVNFVDYFMAGESFYMKKGHKPMTGSGLTQMCGLKVAVESGTTEEADATSAITACSKAHKATVTVRSYNDQAAANLAVSSGQADVGFLDQPIAGYVVSTSKGVFVNTGKPFAAAPYGFAIGKTYPGLDKAILDATKYIYAHGQYAAILKFWGQSSGSRAISENKATF